MDASKFETMDDREYDELPEWMDIDNMDDEQRAAYVAYCNSTPNSTEWLHYVYTYGAPTGCSDREQFCPPGN